MRRRQRRKLRAFIVSALIASGIAFVFHDGPGFGNEDFPSVMPWDSMSHSVARAWVEVTQPLKELRPMALALPKGYQAHWEQKKLDQGHVRLQLLSRNFSLKQTAGGLGSEYYAYAAYLFEQMGREVQEPGLAEKLKTLSTQVQGVGDTLQSASRLKYDGIPRRDMLHLRLREELKALLDDVNPGATMQVAYTEQGKVLAQKEYKMPHVQGLAVKAMLATVQEILSDPAAKHYPQTMHLLQSQSQWLVQVAQHVNLRLDQVQYCAAQCTEVSTKVYAQQTLSGNQQPAFVF